MRTHITTPGVGSETPQDTRHEEATELESRDLTVLQAVLSSAEPLTAGRLAKVTGEPVDHLAAALETLCELRLVRRLNTVVPSYTTRH